MAPFVVARAFASSSSLVLPLPLPLLPLRFDCSVSRVPLLLLLLLHTHICYSTVVINEKQCSVSGLYTERDLSLRGLSPVEAVAEAEVEVEVVVGMMPPCSRVVLDGKADTSLTTPSSVMQNLFDPGSGAA